MDDLISQLTAFLGSEQGQTQLKQVASMLSGNSAPAASAAPAQQMPDLSALVSLLGGNSQQQNGGQNAVPNTGNAGNTGVSPSPPQQNSPPPQGQQAPDLSALASLLSGFMNNNSAVPPPPQENGLNDFLKNLDINKIMLIQKGISEVAKDDNNIALLRALKPLLSEERQTKVDKAIRIMRLIHLVPLIKESGLFGGDWL